MGRRARGCRRRGRSTSWLAACSPPPGSTWCNWSSSSWGFCRRSRSRWRWPADGRGCRRREACRTDISRSRAQMDRRCGSSRSSRRRSSSRPGLVQKAYGARSAQAVRIGVGANAVGLIAFAIVPVILGMVARVLHPNLASPDQALPTLLAVRSATAGRCADACRGLLGRGQRGRRRAVHAVHVAVAGSLPALPRARRRTTRASCESRGDRPSSPGVAGLAMALVLPTVVDALKIFYSLLTVALFVPVVAGLLWHRPGTTAALASICRGDTVDAGHPRRNRGPAASEAGRRWRSVLSSPPRASPQ